ncbi:helix-turn-helix domain-containing protein [uncultured Desulfosarcina sp.]|uniref:helix-turn-helix domain-containing protein n=1 Tax=uncultured Desulfosarcina sp. TaxID=218289 RepID=UPI0029C6C2DE|nr:helix-turn-helix domain-containing protein [uncultured Desulfosarcina sp.]
MGQSRFKTSGFRKKQKQTRSLMGDPFMADMVLKNNILTKSSEEFLWALPLKLLESDRLNVTLAAYEVGYNSIPSFSKAFSNHFGMSPAAFINKPQ